MSTEYDNTNRGALFLNDNRTKDTHPHYKGSLDVSGVPHWISAWLSETKTGKRLIRLQIERKDAQDAPQAKSAPAMPFDPWDAPQAATAQNTATPAGAANANDNDVQDDIPF